MYANPHLAHHPLRLIAWLFIFFSGTALAVPEIEHWTTSKGGRVYYVKTEGLPLVDVRMVFDAGSARDGSLFGLASLTSGMLDSGALDWDADAIAQRLADLGFVPGESVRLTAAGPVGHDPLLVQIGFTRFALRRAEADRVLVEINA